MKYSADAMVDGFRNNDQAIEDLQRDPLGTLEKHAEAAKAGAEIPDTRVYWILVCFVGAVALLLVGGLIYLEAIEKVSDAYFTILGVAVGGLFGALAPVDRRPPTG